ncbi:MAG: tautomerase family protein [Mycobacterium sp.]
MVISCILLKDGSGIKPGTVQITLNEGRSIDQKRALYAAIVKALEQRVGLRPDDVTINLLEVKKENWSFGRGIAHYVDAPNASAQHTNI